MMIDSRVRNIGMDKKKSKPVTKNQSKNTTKNKARRTTKGKNKNSSKIESDIFSYILPKEIKKPEPKDASELELEDIKKIKLQNITKNRLRKKKEFNHKNPSGTRFEYELSNRLQDLAVNEFKDGQDNKLENLTEEEFKDGQDNKLEDLTEEEFKDGQDNKLEDLTEEEFKDGQDNKLEDLAEMGFEDVRDNRLEDGVEDRLEDNQDSKFEDLAEDGFGDIAENKTREFFEHKPVEIIENKTLDIALPRDIENQLDNIVRYKTTDFTENQSDIIENLPENIQDSGNLKKSSKKTRKSHAMSSGKIVRSIKAFCELIQSGLKGEEIREIPEYDSGKYGDIVSFIPPKDFEMVEQTWILKPYVLITILNNRETRRNIYHVSEPVLDPFEEELLGRVSKDLRAILLDCEIDFGKLNKDIILYNNFAKILEIYGINLDMKSLQKIWYFIKRTYVGYDKLDVLLKDPMIEDISCVGADLPVYLYHRKYANIETNIAFEEEELNETIMKLAQICGKSISSGYPMLNARLPDGSRLEATLGREVTTQGGTITIRKFREAPFTPPDLIKYGTFNKETLAYLWLAVENNKSAIFVGATASGKTTTLNAVSLFIPSESKVITIEDTREITLFHKNWIPGVVRETFLGQEAAPIDMFELLRSALRQRPEYLVVGEVRGKEAYALFQAMNTGHTTFSTMHADSIQSAVNRLLNEPLNIPLMMLSSLDIMVVQVLKYVGGRRVRRLETLCEFVGIDTTSGNISIRDLYTWNPLHDTIESAGSSKILDDIMYSRGWSRERMDTELRNREAVLQYMIDNDISDYRDVSQIIWMYSSDPENVMSLISGGKTLLSEIK